ncbi:MAG: glycoside hydrolase family 2 protein [Ruminococcaceae bacterium]|nr:glycoside hydrolase family 2 protein [Oscillospiraceae bacterium]
MREKQLMNRNWLYFFGEPTYPQPKYESSDQQYRGSRAENARGPARRDFFDRDWRRVHLPHDFVAENGVTDDEPFGGEHYDFPRDRGSAWYRRYFRLEEADRDRRIVLHFEAVATKCEVYVNSMLLKVNHTAGIGFDVDITDVARFGTDYNVVAVHADCHDYEAWYYEGGGITRNVWLVKTDRLSVALWGVYAKTKRLDEENWALQIETELENCYAVDRTAHVVSTLLAPDGTERARLESAAQTFPAYAQGTVVQTCTVERPALWDITVCNLYRVVTEVVLDGEIVDRYETKFGFREIRFDADHGFFLNGRSVTIYGFANHMTYLGVGEAMSDSMREFQMRTLRDMGSNGFRMAHSPHGEATYDYCDQYGMLVMDENRVFHSSDICIDEVQRMIRRDRNHPSVIMWSLYNEEDTVTHETGKRIFRTLAAKARQLDDTRPMTGATSYGVFSEHAHEEYDLIGVNHETEYFERLHKFKPGKPIYCSEMVFPLGRKGSDGVTIGLDARVSEKEFVIGGFHFTAWAYGPEKASIFDGMGTPGTIRHGFRAYLRQEEPFAKICPGWDFPGKEGQQVMLNLANNGEQVKVYVNGRLAGETGTDLYAITPFEVVYEPGECRIEVYRDGKLWAEDRALTPGAPHRLTLTMENLSLKADDDDVAIVTCVLTDEHGTPCGNETGLPVTFSHNEAGEFICAMTPREDGLQGYRGPEIRLVDGRAQVLVRSRNTAEPLVIRACAPGVEAAELSIRREPGTLVHVPAVESNYVMDWTVSKLMPYQVDEEKVMREHMIERWEHIDTLGSPDVLYRAVSDPARGIAGLYPPGTSLNYAFHVDTRVPDLGAAEGKKLGLHFEGLDGVANIYVTNGRTTVRAHHPSVSPWGGHYRPELKLVCDGIEMGDQVEIWVFIRDAERVHGVDWPVRWIYTTEEEAAALDVQTAREWNAAKGLL